MAYQVISQRPNNLVALRDTADIARPPDGLVSVESAPWHHYYAAAIRALGNPHCDTERAAKKLLANVRCVAIGPQADTSLSSHAYQPTFYRFRLSQFSQSERIQTRLGEVLLWLWVAL
jgi:hypothetical protein